MLSKNLISNYITPLKPLPTSLRKSGKLDEKINGTLFISGAGDIGIAEKNHIIYIVLNNCF